MVKLAADKKPPDNKSQDKPASTVGRGRGEERTAMGVTASGSALRDAIIVGLLIILVPALAAAAYLYFLRAPAQKTALVNQLAESYAQQQAEIVGSAVANLRQRVKAAVNSPLARETIAEPSPEDFAAAETLMLHYFPEAQSLRLLPLSDMGTAELTGEHGLRNHIEIDLLRRVSNGDVAAPEAYQFEGGWLASLAQVATLEDMPSQRAVVLVTLGESALQALIAQPEDPPGRFTLEQRVYSEGVDRDLKVVTAGETTSAVTRQADVPGTAWRIVFSPSQTLIDATIRNVRPDFDMLGLLALCAVAGLLVCMQRVNAALSQDLQRIVATSEMRSAMDLRVPQLLPVAQELRKLAARSSRNGSKTAAALAQAESKSADRRSTDTTALGAIEGPTERELPAGIFRAYDIRGIADTDLDDETVYRIGSAIGTIAKEMGEQTLVLGYDGRNSSPRIRAVLEKALIKSGRDVINIGLVPTPVLYYAATQRESKSGIMITGSHNPAEYNGLKIVLKGQTIAAGTIQKIRSVATAGNFSRGKGQSIQSNVISEYLDVVISDIAIAVPLKIVVDASNGATGHVAPSLLEELGCEVIPMNCDIDGDFPNHSPDTSNEDNLADLVREVIARGADFGVAYDGDGDRLAVVTGSGKIVRTDTLIMIFARDVVSRNPGADVVYDVKCSRNLAQLVTSLGGRPVLWKTGHALMKEKMVETGALLGGEFSGHIFFGERWFGFDDGMYATGRLAEIISSQDMSLDELLADLPIAVSTPEILIPIDDTAKFEIMERFVAQARFDNGKSNDLDGLRVDFEDGWGLLRASNTGPALTARFEARDEAGLERIKGAFHKQLAAVAPDLTLPF